MDELNPVPGKNGNRLPTKYQWQKGESGNPAGRPNASAAVAEWLNQMNGWTRERLAAVIKDEEAPANKVTAARDWLEAMSPPDVADYEQALDAGKTLQQLRDEGIDTSRIKKMTKRVTKDGTVSHTIELKDDRHSCLERVLDRTGGKPHQSVDMRHTDQSGLGIVVRVEGMAAPELPPAPGEVVKPD